MGGCASAPVVYEYTERDSEQYEAYAQDEAEANYASRTTPDTIGGEPISPDQEYAVELYLWAVDLHKQLAGQHAAGGKIAGTAGTAVGTGVAVAMGVLSEAAGVLLDAGLGLVPAASGVFKFIMDDRRKSRYPQVSELLAGRVADLIAEGDVEHLRLLTLTRRGRDLLKDRARGTGAQAIHAAAAHNRPDIMELLLGAGATLHDAAYERMTPLMFAAAAGSHEALRWILGRSRIEAFHIDALGRSAVHHAAAGGSAACLSALLEARAPRHDAPDGTPDRKRPIEYAREGGHTECVAVLEQWAASA